MSFIPRSARNAAVRLGNTPSVIYGVNWSIDFSSDKLDVSNFESAGFYCYVGGLQKCDYSLDFPWNDQAGAAAGGNIFDTGFNAIPAQPGQVITTGMRFYINGTTGAYWNISSCFVEKVSHKTDVKDVIRATISGSATASFQIPSGATTTQTPQLPS